MGAAVAVASYPSCSCWPTIRGKSLTQPLRKALLRASADDHSLRADVMTAGARQILEIIFQGGKIRNCRNPGCPAPDADHAFGRPCLDSLYGACGAYYAHGDTLTPRDYRHPGSQIVCVPLYYWLAVPLGAWAIPFLSGIAVTVYVAWLAIIWTKEMAAAFCRLLEACFAFPRLFRSACAFAPLAGHNLPGKHSAGHTFYNGLRRPGVGAAWFLPFYTCPWRVFFMPDTYHSLMNRMARRIHLQNGKR